MKKITNNSESVKRIANEIVEMTNSGETSGKFCNDCTRRLENRWTCCNMADEIAALIKEKSGQEVCVSLYTHQIPGGRMRRFAVDVSWRWFDNTDDNSIKKEVKELLKAVIKDIAEGVKDEMIEFVDFECYLDAAWKAEDLVRYNRVLSSLDESISFEGFDKPGVEKKWELKFFEKNGDWDYVRGWITEYSDWTEIVERVAKEEDLEEYAGEVEDLIETTR